MDDLLSPSGIITPFSRWDTALERLHPWLRLTQPVDARAGCSLVRQVKALPGSRAIEQSQVGKTGGERWVEEGRQAPLSGHQAGG